MSGVTGAVIGAGVLAAGATVASGAMAAGATKDASNAAIAQQKNALATQTQLSEPYRDLGESAIDQYKAILGLGPNGAAGAESTLADMPGYKFGLDAANKATTNAASLTGGVSGNTLADLSRTNVGYADSTYQQGVDNLARAVGTGQAAAAGQAQNVGASADNISSTLINQGNTIAGIDANVAAGIAKSANSGISNYLTLQALNA